MQDYFRASSLMIQAILQVRTRDFCLLPYNSMPLFLHRLHCVSFAGFHVCGLSEGSDSLKHSNSSIPRTEPTQKRHSIQRVQMDGGNLWEYSTHLGKPNKGSRHF